MLPFALIGGAIALAVLLVIAVARTPYRGPALLYGALVIGFASVASAATATKSATANVIVVPWGTILSQLLIALTPTIIGLVALLLAWVYSKLPATLVTALKAGHADTLVNRAVNQAIALVEGAVKGKTIDVSIANQVIATAAQFLAQEAPVLVKQLGPRLGKVLAGKLADLNMLGADAHAGNLNLHPLAAPNPSKAVAQ